MAAAWGRRASARSSGCVAYGVALLKRGAPVVLRVLWAGGGMDRGGGLGWDAVAMGGHLASTCT